MIMCFFVIVLKQRGECIISSSSWQVTPLSSISNLINLLYPVCGYKPSAASENILECV